MGLNGSNYERELKGLLQGEPDAVDHYARALPPTDRERMKQAAKTPFLVVRAAGSLGFDLVALRSEFAFPVEVKASSSDTILFSAASGRAVRQLEEHRRAVERFGLFVVYAFRRLGHRGGDPWRLYAARRRADIGRLGLPVQAAPPGRDHAGRERSSSLGIRDASLAIP